MMLTGSIIFARNIKLHITTDKEKYNNILPYYLNVFSGHIVLPEATKI